MATFSSFSGFQDALESTVTPDVFRRVGHYVGGRAKRDVQAVAKQTLGSDMAMSNLNLHRARAVRLGVGYDVDPSGDRILINRRPAGAWALTEGRNARGIIDTDRYAAVNTPQGPRAWSSYGPARGPGTLGRSTGRLNDNVPKDAATAYRRELGKVF